MGDVYRSVGGDVDERVGRVDENGNVYRTAPQDSDERVGEVNEDGSVFRHVPMIPDERLGQVDLKTGKLYRHRPLWPDEHVGWVDAKGNVYRRSKDDDKPDMRLGKVTGGRAYLEGTGAFFLLLGGADG